MDTPFKYISDSTVYTLRWGNYGYYGRNNNNESIDKCITETATYYDQDTVTPVQFKLMIDKITSGAHSSPITQRKCVDDTIQAICIYYPKHLTMTNVTNLIKCMDYSHTTSVEYIESTGYKFTSAQIKALNKVGILMIDKLESMTLSEFYSLFDNETFKNKINTKWDVNPYLYTIDENDKEKETYHQFIVINKIIKKFNIELDSEIWNYMLPLIHSKYNYSSYTICVTSLINLHRVLVALGAKTDKAFLDKIFKNYTINQDGYNKKDCVAYLDEVFDFYKDISFNRETIIEYESDGAKADIILLLLESKYCSYDMFRDLYYWLEGTNTQIKSYLINRIVELKNENLFMQIVSISHVSFSYFKNYVDYHPDCGWDNERFIRTLLSFNRNNDYTQLYVDNKLIVSKDLLEYMWNKDSIKTLYENCTSYTEDGFSEMTRIKNDAIIDNELAYHPESLRYSYRILKSMDSRTRRIYSHILSSHSMMYLSDIQIILRYDIRITKEHLEYFMRSGSEKKIITLLHISNKFDYLIDMIDLDLILKCDNYLPRIWFYNNIITPRLIDNLTSTELSFCPIKNTDRYIFSVKQNDAVDSDLTYNIIDKFEEIEKQFVENIQEVQESALDRILENKN